ncbi:hypothetical protein ACFFGT_25110 [Mucilaginibacter angelicae]|uniref:NfeD-like C-terminal domain-containing protein n=1 Tax=Mucilaginibacter angelicae TaxID=869718 RepID=A0ABV6LDJ3_9SPHI
MEQEFGLARGWKIFSYVASVLFVIVAIGMSYGVLADGKPVLLAFSIPLFFGSVYMLISTRKYKLTVSDSQIAETGVFTTIVIQRTDIEGFKIDGNILTVLPRQKGQKKIRINGYQYLENNHRLINWLNYQFDELNERAYVKETEEILSNPDFGFTDQEKAARFKQARLVARIYNIISFGFLITPYIDGSIVLNTIMLIYPFAGILLLFLYNGIIRMDTRGKTNYPYITFGLIMPSLCLTIIAFNTYEVLGYANIWIPVLVIGAVLFVLLNEANKKALGEKYKSQFLPIIMVIVFYVFGAAVIINCDFDRSAPVSTTAKVVKQFKTTGKIVTYSLTLSPWGIRQHNEDVNIPGSLYHNIAPGDIVQVNVKKGFLRIPWFYISK